MENYGLSFSADSPLFNEHDPFSAAKEGLDTLQDNENFSVEVESNVFNLTLESEAMKYQQIKEEALISQYEFHGHNPRRKLKILWEDRYNTKDGSYLAAMSWAILTNIAPLTAEELDERDETSSQSGD